MALFSKPPAKKPHAPPPKPAAGGRAASARELAASAGGKGEKPRVEPVHADDSITGSSLVEWSQQQPAFEVAQANPGLCAVLENAALLFASGQAAGARALLEQGIGTDHDTRQSPLAWLALFDLLQRAGDRAAFEQHALSFSVQFERSAPMWEERNAPKAAGAAPAGYIAVSGRLGAESKPQIEGLRRAIAKKVAHARLDLGAVAGFDDAGAQLLATALADARKARVALAIERAHKLQAALDAAVKLGRDGGEGPWQLSLELLQWSHDQTLFDDRAIEYAIAFEMSPPSWEPPPVPPAAAKPTESSADPAHEDTALPADAEAVQLSGVLSGQATPQLAKVQEFAQGRQIVAVDVTAVERIDFVCDGALLNVVSRIEAQRKSVQVVGASPIIRALLLLIGLPPRHFVKKAA
jgi:ABC-type transporter Mla MlaB component